MDLDLYRLCLPRLIVVRPLRRCNVVSGLVTKVRETPIDVSEKPDTYRVRLVPIPKRNQRTGRWIGLIGLFEALQSADTIKAIDNITSDADLPVYFAVHSDERKRFLLDFNSMFIFDRNGNITRNEPHAQE